jgi:N-acetylglutamate synthase-like GNAT family acetyltransferase
MIVLRPATAADQPRIRAIIRAARINPLGTRWQNFVLAVDAATGAVIGTGQIKRHNDRSRELASIAVVPAYQHQGVGHRIITYLLEHHHGTLFLTCRSPLGEFYAQFGFRVVAENEMTPYFRRLRRVARLVGFLARTGETLLVMRRDR